MLSPRSIPGLLREPGAAPHGAPLDARRLLWGLALAALVLIAYVPAYKGGWIWDDDDYVTRNTTLRTAEGLWRIWTDPKASPQYYPVTFTSFWIEQKLWGLRPAGYHVTNVLLHAAGCVALWGILRWLDVPGAWAIAAVWGVHPVNAESVAWVTERKNVLSGVFYLLAMGVYLRLALPAAGGRWPAGNGWIRYLGALGLFVLALLSKSVTATWPAAVLLILWWKRGRIGWRDVWPLAPFFVLGIGMGVVTSLVERFQVGAGGEEFAWSFWQRCLIAGRIAWFYAAKDILPVGLSFIYHKWAVEPWQWVFPASVAAVLAGLWLARKRAGRGPLAAVLFFLGTLAPALGFINVYPMRFSFVADHFQYLASIGVLALVVGAVARHAPPAAFRFIGGVVLASLIVLTWQRNGILADAERLWRDTIAKNPSAWMAHTNLGVLLLDRAEARLRAGRSAGDELSGAATAFEATRRLRPDLVWSYTNLGRVAEVGGDLGSAEQWMGRAVTIDPGSADAHFHLGRVRVASGRVDEGIAAYRRAIDLDPRHEPVRVNLGNVLADQGQLDDAIAQYRAALRIDRDSIVARVALGYALLEQGKNREAAEEFGKALRIEPGFAPAEMGLRRARN